MLPNPIKFFNAMALLAAATAASASALSAATEAFVSFVNEAGFQFVGNLATSPVGLPPQSIPFPAPSATVSTASETVASAPTPAETETTGKFRRTKAESDAGLTLEEAKQARANGWTIEQALTAFRSTGTTTGQAPVDEQKVTAPEPTKEPAPAEVKAPSPAASGTFAKMDATQLRAAIEPLIKAKQGNAAKATIARHCGVEGGNLALLATLDASVQQAFIKEIDAMVAALPKQEGSDF